MASGGYGPKNLGESPSARGWSFSPDLHSECAADDSWNITKPGYSLLIPHPILLDSKNWKYSGSELMLFYRTHVHVSESYGVVDQWSCPAITLIITLNSIQSQTVSEGTSHKRLTIHKFPFFLLLSPLFHTLLLLELLYSVTSFSLRHPVLPTE